jgi:hypothetical protein
MTDEQYIHTWTSRTGPLLHPANQIRWNLKEPEELLVSRDKMQNVDVLKAGIALELKCRSKKKYATFRNIVQFESYIKAMGSDNAMSHCLAPPKSSLTAMLTPSYRGTGVSV